MLVGLSVVLGCVGRDAGHVLGLGWVRMGTGGQGPSWRAGGGEGA